jgi:hypothetical protein
LATSGRLLRAIAANSAGWKVTTLLGSAQVAIIGTRFNPGRSPVNNI